MELIPIRIDIELEGYHFQDTFTWISPTDNSLIENFVDALCHDFDLPPAVMKLPIIKTMKEQIIDFNTYSSSSSLTTLPIELRSVRILIKLDIICNLLWLTDQFEWEVFNMRNSPEDFAATYCNELKLPWEFRSAVVHAIREQSFLFQKTLLTTGYRIDSQSSTIHFNDSEVVDCVIFPVHGISPKQRLLRTPDLLESFTPKIIQLTLEELERLDYSRKRENRRKKRSTFSLTSPPKTHRTFLGYKGSTHRQVATSDYDDDGNMDRRSAGSRRSSRKISATTASTSALASGDSFINCYVCGNAVYPSDLGICSSCGNISLQPFQHSPSLDNASKPDESRVALPSPSSGNRRGRKPGSTSKPRISEQSISNADLLSKPDIEPLPEHLQSQIPEWLVLARKRLDEKYPLDLFTIVIEDGDPKIKCIECKKIYSTGPYTTLTNFETHLKNKSHRGNVEKRLESTKNNTATLDEHQTGNKTIS